MSVKEVILTIGGKQIEISEPDKLRLSISRSINEIQNVEQSNASRSKTVVVPGTKQNDLALGFGQDINSITAISQNIKPNALLEVAGTIIIQGFVRVTKRVIKGVDKTHEYHLILIGDNGDWKHKINGLNVNDLDYSEFDHVYNKVNIDASELTDSSGIPLTRPDIVYPLINYGTTLDMPHPLTSEDNLHTVQVKNRFPAIQKRSIIKKIFEGAGLKINSVFIDSDSFRKRYMPFTNKAFLHPESFREPKLFRIGITDPLIDKLDNEDAPFFDNGDNYSDTEVLVPASIANFSFFHTYTVPEDSFMNFILETAHVRNLTSTSGTSGNFNRIGILKPNGVEQVYNSAAPEYPGGIPPLKFKVRHETGMQFWEAGTIVFADFFQPQTDAVIDGTAFYNEVKIDVLPGNTVTMNSNLPDIEQIDFIRGIRDEFNLMILTDLTNRQVFIEPHDDFYTTKAIDWTDKLDLSRDQTIEDLNGNLSKTLHYSFKKDSKDAVVEQINIQSDVDLASLDVENSNKFVEGEQVIGASLFAPTLMDIWPYVGLLTAKVPRLNKDAVDFPSASVQSTDFVLRSLYYEGITPLPDGEQWFFEGIARTDYPYMHSVDEENDNDNSSYWNNTRRSNGLFQKYHRNRFDIRDKGKLYIAYFNLNDTDMSTLDFRVPIFVIDTYYLLNLVNGYEPLSNVTTKVELITALNMNIKAIIDGLNQPVFPALPPVGFIPVSIDSDESIQANNDLYLSNGPTFNNSSDGFGVQAVGQGNESNLPGVTSYGAANNIGQANQVTYGNNNQLSTEAQYLVGAGTRTEEKTVLKISSDGTLKSGNGSNIRMTINGISHAVTYTDGRGEEQLIVMTDEDQLGQCSSNTIDKSGG